jgi:hypothetical protein
MADGFAIKMANPNRTVVQNLHSLSVATLRDILSSEMAHDGEYDISTDRRGLASLAEIGTTLPRYAASAAYLPRARRRLGHGGAALCGSRKAGAEPRLTLRVATLRQRLSKETE